MDINLLREFTLLVASGNYTSAAKILYMSQPSLSRHISGLEKELGVQLFFDDKPLTLTRAGELVMRNAPDILQAYDRMNQQLSELSNDKPILIRIQDLLHFETMYTNIHTCIEETTARFPSVVFKFVKVKNHLDTREALSCGDIDIGFLFGLSNKPFHLSETSGFLSFVMTSFSGELAFGIKKDSPLKQRGTLAFSDFSDKSFLFEAKKEGSEFVKAFCDTCTLEGFYPKIEYVITSNALDFYSRDPKEAVIPITRMQKGNTAFDRHVQQNMSVIVPRSNHGPYFVSSTLVVRDEPSNAAFDFFFTRLKELESQHLANK